MNTNRFLKAILCSLVLWSTALHAQSPRAEQDPDLVWQKDEGYSVVEFSPDGKWLLTHGKEAGDVVIRDIKDGEILHTFPNSRKVEQAHFSPDGTLVATADEKGIVRLWSIAENKVIHAFMDAPESAYNTTSISLDFSSDGRLLVLGSKSEQHVTTEEPNLYVWDIAAGKLQWKKRLARGMTVMAQFISGTPNLYAYNTFFKRGVIYNAQTGDSIATANSERFYSKDGRFYTIPIPSSDPKYKDIAVYTTETDNRVSVLATKYLDLYGKAFSPKNGFAVFATFGAYSTQIWDIKNARLVGTLPPSGAYLAISHDSLYIATTGNNGNTTRLYSASWEPTTVIEFEQARYQLRVTPNPTNDLASIRFHLPSPETVTCSVINITGEIVAEVFKGQLSEGEQHLTWQTSNVSQGLYYIRLEIAGQVTIHPITIQRGE